MRRGYTNPEDIDVLTLARKAKAKKNSDPEQIVQRLLAIIARNTDYVAGKNYHSAYSDLVAEDNEFLAAAIVLIESRQ